jgi:hypothetical protein
MVGHGMLDLEVLVVAVQILLEDWEIQVLALLVKVMQAVQDLIVVQLVILAVEAALVAWE